MVTVVNQTPDKDTGLGTVVAVVLVILIILAILFWSGPIIRRYGAAATPVTETSAPNKVDINVNNGSDSTNQQTQTMQPSAQPQTTLAPNPTNSSGATPMTY